MRRLALLEAANAIPPGAHCTGAFTRGIEFIDVSADEAHVLARAYCDHCPVTVECASLGRHGAPDPDRGALRRPLLATQAARLRPRRQEDRVTADVWRCPDCGCLALRPPRAHRRG